LKVKVVDSGLPFHPALKYPRLVVEVPSAPDRGLYVAYEGRWVIYVQGKDGYPRRQGAYAEFLTAIYYANKGT
jgi:hypothetical protein